MIETGEKKMNNHLHRDILLTICLILNALGELQKEIETLKLLRDEKF